MEKQKIYNFNKLWHRLIDQEMSKKELAERAGVAVSSISRLKKGIPLSYDRMKRICEVVGCEKIEDIMEEVEDELTKGE